jgi:hypothetical protein
MSRSYRKTPGCSDGGSGVKHPYLKVMNTRVRRQDLFEEDSWLPNGNTYRKFVCRWSWKDYQYLIWSERDTHGWEMWRYRMK